MKFDRLEHCFCKHIPELIEPGVLYVSMEYTTATHCCCCGCGEEVVTPFTPTDWIMMFDGEAISLWPSVGNWTLTCRSHYVIRDGNVIEARPWTDEEIAAERRRDRAAKAQYFGTPLQEEVVHGITRLPSRILAWRRWGLEVWKRALNRLRTM